MLKQVYWVGTVPAKDDFGGEIGLTFFDAKSIQGPWGIMNEANFKIYGIGCGQGMGQRYDKQTDGRWLKVRG
jgi:hypothetical protein